MNLGRNESAEKALKFLRDHADQGTDFALVNEARSTLVIHDQLVRLTRAVEGLKDAVDRIGARL